MITDIDRKEVTYTPKEAAKICLKSIIKLGYFGDEIDCRFLFSNQLERNALYTEIERMSIELIEKFLEGK